MDVKAEHFERQVTRLEQERDSWEKKYEVSFLTLTTCFVLAAGWNEVSWSLMPYSAGNRSEVQGIQERARRARYVYGRPLIPSMIPMYHTASFWRTGEVGQLLIRSRFVRHGGSHDLLLRPTFTLHVDFIGHSACV